MLKQPIELWAEEFFTQNHNSYKKQVISFIKFLKTPQSNRIGQAALLTETDIDEFIGCSPQINSIDTMASYLEGLKSFDDFLLSKGYNIKYIIPRGEQYANFKKRLAEKYSFKERVERDYLPSKDIQRILNSLDEYFMKTQYVALNKEGKERFIYWLCLRVYIKLSLLAPAKKSKLLELSFNNFGLQFRTVTINDMVIKIPNGLRYNILQSLDIIAKESGVAWKSGDCFFEYFTTAVKLKKELIGTALNAKFCKYLKDYKLLDIDNEKTSFSLEVLSNSTIYQMIRNGTNPYYISQITGISIGQLASKYYSKLEEISSKQTAESEINKSITICDYYQYL
ncbi:hypothetical protein [Enterococcus sp.]|uniref:hypothetical protein n=1 Tax=Enterococcus sp. TaxID=35783 RepID=UPI002897043F|nr:hypothetical protein [Enterococcus sp.]